MGLLSNSMAAHPSQTKLDLDLVIMQVPVSHTVHRGLKPTLFIFIPPFISNHTVYKNKHTHPFADHVFQK